MIRTGASYWDLSFGVHLFSLAAQVHGAIAAAQSCFCNMQKMHVNKRAVGKHLDHAYFI